MGAKEIQKSYALTGNPVFWSDLLVDHPSPKQVGRHKASHAMLQTVDPICVSSAKTERRKPGYIFLFFRLGKPLPARQMHLTTHYRDERNAPFEENLHDAFMVMYSLSWSVHVESHGASMVLSLCLYRGWCILFHEVLVVLRWWWVVHAHHGAGFRRAFVDFNGASLVPPWCFHGFSVCFHGVLS